MRMLVFTSLVLSLIAFDASAARKVDNGGGSGNGNGGTQTGSMNGNEQWACEVAMCMSNPGGPTEFAECDAPIRKMLKEQAKGHKIPKCKFLSGGDNGGGGNTGGGSRDPESPVDQQQR